MEIETKKFYLDDFNLKSCPIHSKPANITVIDGDGFAYIIGWSFSKEFIVTPDLIDAVNEKIDGFIHSILAGNKADYFIGVLEAEIDYNLAEADYVPVANFRQRYAVSQAYKGKRPEKPEWYRIWAPYVQKRLIEKWNFQRVPSNVEADDMVVSLITFLKRFKNISTVLTGNDKDLLQCPGVYLNYRTNESTYITERDANKNLYKQVLMGDTTDNIIGLRGCGEKGANAVISIEEFNEKSGYMYTLREFVRKLGEDRGIQAFHESYMLCKLRTDLAVHSYYITEFKAEQSSAMQQMRELLGSQEVNDIIVEHKLNDADFSGGGLFDL